MATTQSIESAECIHFVGGYLFFSNIVGDDIYEANPTMLKKGIEMRKTCALRN